MIAPIRTEGAGGPSLLQAEFRVPRPRTNSRGRARKNLVFVIMSFGADSSHEIYWAIKEECSGQGLEAFRVDENVSSGFILKEILELIERAEFIICDLSDERPNVYYELGYAHGVGNRPSNILLLAKAGTCLHFDIVPLRVHHYGSTEDLRITMRTTFAELVEAKRSGRRRSRPRGHSGSRLLGSDL